LLDENVLVVDFDANHWKRLINLFARSKGASPSFLFLIVEQGVCLKAIHSQKGALRPFDYQKGDLAALAEREKVDYIASVRRDFLQKAFAAGESDVHFDDDYIKQILDIYNGVIDYTSETIEWYPHRPYAFHELSYEKIQKNFNRLLPDQRTFFFCVMDEGRVFTSLIAGKRSGDITLLTTLDTLQRNDTPFDIEEDLPEVLAEIEEKFEAVHLYFIIEKAAFREMLAGKRPLTYLKAAQKHGRALLSPLPFRLRLAFWAARVFRGM